MKILTIKVLKIWFLLFALFGCALGDKIVFRPDVYINYTPHLYYRYPRYEYGYGSYYLYYPVVIQNTSISSFIEVTLDGKPILPRRIPPGKTETANVRVEIGERREIILTAACYTASGRLTDTAHRKLPLNIGPYERRADIWPVYCRDP